MHCEKTLENLAALLHRELATADEMAVEAHLSECPACRDELQNQRNVLRSLRRMAPVEPSACTRRGLKRRLDEAMDARLGRASESNNLPPALLAALDLEPRPPAPTRSRPEPPRVPTSTSEERTAPTGSEAGSASGTAAPQSLVPEPDGAPVLAQLAALSPSARAVSAQLSASARKRRRRSFMAKVLALPVLGLALLLGALAWHSDRPKGPAPDAHRIQRAASARRWNERGTAKAQGKVLETFLGTQVQLQAASHIPALFHVLGHHEPRTGETCLVAYSEADILFLQADEKIDQAALGAILKRAIAVDAVDGKCTLPRELVENYIGAGQRQVSVISLGHRTELWPAARLTRYLTSAPAFNPECSGDPPAFNALPPEK